MAQFREVQAFAQFGSELDKATKAQLDRGQRITEVLKQPQYAPVPLEKQVMVLYAVINGFMDDVSLDKIRAFEAGFLQFMDTAHSDIGSAIVRDKTLSDDTVNALRAAIEEFKRTSSF